LIGALPIEVPLKSQSKFDRSDITMFCTRRDITARTLGYTTKVTLGSESWMYLSQVWLDELR